MTFQVKIIEKILLINSFFHSTNLNFSLKNKEYILLHFLKISSFLFNNNHINVLVFINNKYDFVRNLRSFLLKVVMIQVDILIKEYKKILVKICNSKL